MGLHYGLLYDSCATLTILSAQPILAIAVCILLQVPSPPIFGLQVAGDPMAWYAAFAGAMVAAAHLRQEQQKEWGEAWRALLGGAALTVGAQWAALAVAETPFEYGFFVLMLAVRAYVLFPQHQSHWLWLTADAVAIDAFFDWTPYRANAALIIMAYGFGRAVAAKALLKQSSGAISAAPPPAAAVA
jgi:hypothetical protein